MSGGLDSSSIVGMARALYRDGVLPATRFETYSLIYPPPADEREYIRAVADTPTPSLLDRDSALAQVKRYKDVPDHPDDAVSNS